MQLNRIYDCKHCTEGFVGALEHWKDQCFSTDDDYAHEVVQMFDDKIHEVKLKLEKLELRKTKLKTYKFWNPEHVDRFIELTQGASIDPQTCTAAELTKAEADGKISTDILLIVVQMFDDKIHEVKLKLEKLELRKTKLKTYKFWNPDHVSNYISLDVIDPHTCTAAELTKAETNGNISTDILLIDDKQADAIVQMFINESVYPDLRYEEIKENV